MSTLRVSKPHMNGNGTSGIDLLKPSEVATRLRVSRTWLYDAAKQGRIPSVGRSVGAG
ncbi:MAG TPA: helix-turn-helix domain-containing protein [Solirubrobacteraceae bacterium]|nr:helix-turn-helix domain-containing protein [Solirubrobacteraceae bacterium]